jgi:hypothetical protein
MRVSGVAVPELAAPAIKQTIVLGFLKYTFKRLGIV